MIGSKDGIVFCTLVDYKQRKLPDIRSETHMLPFSVFTTHTEMRKRVLSQTIYNNY